jgi:hypothetical protein
VWIYDGIRIERADGSFDERGHYTALLKLDGDQWMLSNSGKGLVGTLRALIPRLEGFPVALSYMYTGPETVASRRQMVYKAVERVVEQDVVGRSFSGVFPRSLLSVSFRYCERGMTSIL